jgi:NAD(P)-dependent dehydrogenase (short-subunit alcohol dehydrogenase family)
MLLHSEREAPMDLQLTNKKALVTGSTAGIGLAIASPLALTTLLTAGSRTVRTPARIE